MESKINWVQKFSSRKFWAALGAWASSILAVFNFSESAIAQVSILIAGIGALAVYMLAESYVDGKSREASILADSLGVDTLIEGE